MAERVYDASFVGYANCSLDEPTPERQAFLRQLLDAIVQVIRGHARLRCNPALLTEYARLLKDHRNDVIDEFVAILDDERTIIVKRNTLRSNENAKADKCGWPFHDRHLLAAAIGGTEVTIHVTESRLGVCAAMIWRVFEVRVHHVPVILPEA